MYICGQTKLLDKINHLVEFGRFPRFSIFVGNIGSGKKLISDYVAKQIGANFVPCDIKADSVREVIYNSYTVTEKTLYMFFDCDGMSVTSKNALLKVTEEPPNDSYFIMTVQDINSVLGTIVSRGTVFYLDPYTQTDLQNFINEKKIEFKPKELSIVKSICSTPQDVLNCSKLDVTELYNLADKFIQFIGSANLANEFKISTFLNLKKDEESEKFDPILYLRCIMLCCNNYLLENCSKEDTEVFCKIIKNTSKHLSELQMKGSSKQMIIDNWILNTHIDIAGGVC